MNKSRYFVKELVILGLVFGFGYFGILARSVSASEEPVRVATVDMQKALQSVEAGKKARSSLEGAFNAKKKEFQTEENAIKKMGDEFKKQAAVMNEDARMKKQMEISERIARFQELTARSQGEIQMKERELTGPIIIKLRNVIGDMAKKRGYSVVLERNENNVLYSQEKDDLTAEVVSTFNKNGG